VKTLGLILAVLALALAIYLAVRSQRVLEAGLPPRLEHATQALALVAAGPQAVPVAGTGSMAPFIPAALPGAGDPRTIVVAYITPRPGAGISDITPGALVIYRPVWNNGLPVIHGAALRDSAGWVMSGLANARSEPGERVTTENFVALVESVHLWPLATR
jgi:hypothetical protein